MGPRVSRAARLSTHRVRGRLCGPASVCARCRWDDGGVIQTFVPLTRGSDIATCDRFQTGRQRRALKPECVGELLQRHFLARENASVDGRKPEQGVE